MLRDGRPRQVHGQARGAHTRARTPRRRSTSETADARTGRSQRHAGPAISGLTVIEIDETNSHRFDVRDGMTGLLVQRVEPLSAA